MDDARFLVSLHSIGLSQKSLGRLFGKEENYEAIYQSLDAPMLEKIGVRSQKIEEVLKAKVSMDGQRIQDVLERLQVQVVTVYDSNYPILLKESPVHPFFLYVRGTLKDIPLIAVVGSRKSTAYSRTGLGMIIPDLVRAGYGIVSGGAHGVDSLSHRVALEHEGYTASIFGTGIDQCYPRENRELFERIVSSWWALVSAFPIGTGPESYNFPVRNEVVAGISRWVLITEAAEKSGTLITAGLALDFGRDVFALPGDITKVTSVWANALIRDGQAKLVLGAGDILSEYSPLEPIAKKMVAKRVFEDPMEDSIYSLLAHESLDASWVSQRLGIDIATVAFKLSMLEVRGIVDMRIGGGYEAR